MEETKLVPPGACGRGRELTFFMMPEPTLDERSFAAESSCFHQARAGADLAAFAAAPFAAPAEAAFFEAPDATASFAASFPAPLALGEPFPFSCMVLATVTRNLLACAVAMALLCLSEDAMRRPAACLTSRSLMSSLPPRLLVQVALSSACSFPSAVLS